MVKLPALNTPQFTWSKNRMGRKAQPVPPIYQPEVVADAIVWAAHHYRREWFVGGPTTVVIAGNRLAPGLGDRYLARTGYESQMHDGCDDPNRPDNLFHALDEDRDFGAHGEFDDRSRPRSVQLWADQRRGWVGRAGIAGAALALLRGRRLKGAWRGGLAGLAMGAICLAALAAANACVSSAKLSASLNP